MANKQFTEEQLQELHELQKYFCTDSERSIKMFRLIGLQLLAVTDNAQSVEEIRQEAKTILKYFRG